ncbi:MAG: hypothetical protein ABIG42_10005, partial [bacterium]
QALSVPTNRSTFRAMSGNFQRQSCWDSAGYAYILTAEDNGAGATKRIAVYRSVNGGFDLTAGFTFQADTTIANGYSADEILNLNEFSAVYRNDKIYIVANFIDPPTVLSGVVIISYDINTKRFAKVDYLVASISPATPYVNSVDISVASRRAHGDIIASWLEYNSTSSPTVLLRRYLREILPRYNAMGTGGIGYINDNVNFTTLSYPSFLNNFDGDSEIWNVLKLQKSNLDADFTMANIPREEIRGITSAPNNITLGSSNGQSFGNFKALYNEKFNLEALAHWRRLTAPKAGWELDFGVRSPDGIFNSFQIIEFDYANLGVSNVLVDIPNVRPEVLLVIDDQGGVYIIGSYPNPGSRPLTGIPGPGRIDNPYYNIAMAYWASDDFDDLSGANYETVWNGAATQTQVRYLNAPDIFPAGDMSAIRSSKLFISCVDTLNDPTGHALLYRD